MSVGGAIRASINKLAKPLGYALIRRRTAEGDAAFRNAYNQDGLLSIHLHDFMQDPGFVRAYQRGVKAADIDYRWHWRAHVGLWCAYTAAKVDGDFVECGVNRGFLSSAIMEDLDWNSLDKTFYLLDTFAGIDENLATKDELAEGIMQRNDANPYNTNLELVRKNCEEWHNVDIIVGPVPDTLDQLKSDRFAYVYIGMDCMQPEVDAFNYFWERLTPGGIIQFDCYSYFGYGHHKEALDKAAEEKGVVISSFPTGQGIVIKPHPRAGA